MINEKEIGNFYQRLITVKNEEQSKGQIFTKGSVARHLCDCSEVRDIHLHFAQCTPNVQKLKCYFCNAAFDSDDAVVSLRCHSDHCSMNVLKYVKRLYG